MLRAHRFGRLAFSFDGRVDVEPLHYVFDQGWIFGRLAAGTKLDVLRHHPWVAFEIDEVTSDTANWRSVVAKGTVYFVGENAPDMSSERYDGVVRLLRSVVPSAFTEDDPTPERTTLFGMHIDELHGRGSVLGAGIR
jgi:nitroimidazol reductase NimA-like FMN-containing flavoprotein (pyridoxamine 5'-phosphate oxidase superfamily)